MPRIKLHVEPRTAGYQEVITEIPDDEWNAMTAAEQVEACVALATDFQQEIAPSGYEVLDWTPHA